MSLAIINQHDQTLSGLILFHADPSWNITEFEQSSDLLFPGCANSEGTGSWIVFDGDNSIWGIIMRRSDTPYNDCLPPSESLLLDGFKEKNSIPEILDFVEKRSTNEFFNPFNILLGNKSSNEIKLLKQSFTTNKNVLKEGVHVLEDDQEINSNNLEVVNSFRETFPSHEKRKHLLDNDELNTKPGDGMRSIVSKSVFDWNNNKLKLSYKNENSNDPVWINKTIKKF